jgi:rifampicin phosphotransferase
MSYVKLLAELGPHDLNLAGGKGANLGALIAAGFPVPPGFCIVTDAYQTFVAANHLEPEIRHLSGLAQAADPASLEAASAPIRALFVAGQIPADLVREIGAAYAGLSAPGVLLAVAVRSSATAEDLPEMSFAGQQDTYLNIVGEAALLKAVAQCWGSLWTARALGYRLRNEIPQDEVALAVVVQQMVPSEASGVLFTANPLTGTRTETVIDATLGLGEALVSGQVEPDHYVVETVSGQILHKTLGAKALAIHGQSSGGTVTVNEGAAERQALPDAQIRELAELGQRIAQVFGTPQDIEWAWAGGRLSVVQSRPITSLFPLPALLTDGSLRLWLAFAVWQGMLDPFTPLGRDMLASLVVGIGRRLGASQTVASQRVVVTAGERLYVDITPILRNSFGRKALPLFVAAIDPASAGTLEKLAQDPRLSVLPGRFKFSTLWQLMPFFAPLLLNVIANVINPAAGRKRIRRRIDASLIALSHQFSEATTLAGWLALFEITLSRQPFIWLPTLLGAVVSGQAAFQPLLRIAAASLPGGEQLALEVTRGLPHNVTTEMDLALWAAAQAVRKDAAALDYLTRTEAVTLTRDYFSGKLPPAAQVAVGGFLEQYGVRGVGEIDFGRTRWSEDPTHIFQVLKSYLQLTAVEASPAGVFERGAARAEAAGNELVAALRKTPQGWLKAPLAAWQISRVRALAGLRETPKFSVIRLMSLFRGALLACGQKLAADGRLARADDLFYLHLDELKSLAAGQGDWRALVAERRQAYARELRRRQLPRLLLSDGRAFYDGMRPADAAGGAGTADDNTLLGSPVSAGVVEGVVHVIFDPRSAQLVPGEILVCPATDPAWTPLFLAAGGLVMEVGGMMTHGSVVAREYGIPAVVGVDAATTRLKTGQHIRMDGSTGQIVILEAGRESAAG